MFLKVKISLIYVVLFWGCATSPKKKVDPVASKSEVIEEKVIREQIHGTAHIDPSKGGSKYYFLYGAEHLKLENHYFDIPVVYNKVVYHWMNYFLNKGKVHFTRYSERAGRYAPLIGNILEKNGLPRDLIFLAMAESGFHPKAKSWARAVGPWQFIRGTGKRYGLKMNWYVDERRDPIKATVAASKYLRKLHSYFGKWELAAAAYNAGEGKINRAIRRYRTENFWELRRGRYLKPETKNYVPKIMALAIIGKNLPRFGFNDLNYQSPFDFEEVVLNKSVDLLELAKCLDMTFEDMQYFNPEIMRWQTPPGTYHLRLPRGGPQKYNKLCKDKDFTPKSYQFYTVRGGGKLKDVARKFRIKTRLLADLNDWSPRKSLRRGDRVRLPFRVGQKLRDRMYKDLYERAPRRRRRYSRYRARIRRAKFRGRNIRNPQEYYVVKKGDTLWDVSKRTGVSLDTIIRSNLRLVSGRMIRAGDRLVVR